MNAPHQRGSKTYKQEAQKNQEHMDRELLAPLESRTGKPPETDEKNHQQYEADQHSPVSEQILKRFVAKLGIAKDLTPDATT